MLLKVLALLLLLLLVPFLQAQSPQIVRYIPGIYRENTLHRIDLYNPTSLPLSLGRWLLVTRDYSFEFPAGVVIGPRQRLTIGKTSGDLRLHHHPNFLIRIPDMTQAGHYVVLIDPAGQARTGVYLAPIAQVRFLPDSGVHYSQPGRPISFYVPSETAPIWQFVAWDPDPITGVSLIRGQWRYTTADEAKERLLYAPVRFSRLFGESDSVGVLLTYEVEVREPRTRYWIERRTSTEPWRMLAIQSCPSPGRYRYEYRDTTALPDLTYEYRLAYGSPDGDTLSSLPLALRTRWYVPPFQIHVTPGFLRLYIERGQPIKIKLLNRHYEEILRLHDGWLNGGVENVFTWDHQRFAQAYCLVVWTPTRRYWQVLLP